jgi:hypothetical protein
MKIWPNRRPLGTNLEQDEDVRLCVNQDLVCEIVNLVRAGSRRGEAGPQNVVPNATRLSWDQP